MTSDVVIRPYTDADERGWLECRVLAFLDGAYYDSVEKVKERWERPSIELVAEAEGRIVGLIDLECEEEPGTVCRDGPGLGAMIWHLAVLPEFRRRGLASRLLADAETELQARGIERVEAWTRDDKWVQRWYESQGFEQVYSYLHVYVQGRSEVEGTLQSLLPDLKPVSTFAHYEGNRKDEIRARFERVHDCVCYERRL